MPDIDDRICKRQTTARIDKRYIQQQGNAHTSFCDAGPEQLAFNVVRADFLLGA
jgi:hypothetical protein